MSISFKKKKNNILSEFRTIAFETALTDGSKTAPHPSLRGH